jgi:TonB-dependent SusC/RagA subfamily outer membrane receptor
MKHVLIIGLLLFAGTAAAQTPVRLSEKVVKIMKTELNYVYDSTSNRRAEPRNYKMDTVKWRLHKNSSLIHNPSPLVIMDGMPTRVEALGSLSVAVVSTIEVLSPKDRYATAIYGTRAAKGVILITTKQ